MTCKYIYHLEILFQDIWQQIISNRLVFVNVSKTKRKHSPKLIRNSYMVSQMNSMPILWHIFIVLTDIFPLKYILKSFCSRILHTNANQSSLAY